MGEHKTQDYEQIPYQVAELNKQIILLKAENEELKKQYNCYACGNCNGKEDYINLEKHHIGLRKQYDKYSQCLDEIEGIEKAYCKKCLEKVNKSGLYCVKCIDKSILDTIKKAKEGVE